MHSQSDRNNLENKVLTMNPRYMWRSEPQIAVLVILSMASFCSIGHFRKSKLTLRRHLTILRSYSYSKHRLAGGKWKFAGISKVAAERQHACRDGMHT